MRTKLLNILCFLAVSGGLAGNQLAMASEPADFAKILAATSVVEMPAKAASLVGKTGTPQERKNAAVAVVKAAVRLNPTIAVAVVGAISQSNPELAPVAAATAASLQHKQLASIAKAAAAAAPSQAGKIVAALIKEFPSSYAVIAISASEGAPLAGKEILEVVADYVPALQASINSAIASFSLSAAQPQSTNGLSVSGTSSTQRLPVSAILEHATDQPASSAPVASGVSMATQNPLATRPMRSDAQSSPLPATPTPPILPLPPQTNPQSPGGRNYATP